MGDFLVIRPQREIVGGYLEYLLRSNPVIDEINSSTYVAKMPRAGRDFIAGMRYPIPPTAEQRAIAAHLDGRMAAIDAAIAHCEREAALAREYWV